MGENICKNLGNKYIYNFAFGRLWQYHRDEQALINAGSIVDFPNDTDNASSKFKQKIADQTANYCTKYIKIMVPLKYLSNFLGTIEMSLYNCEINLLLTWSENCFILAGAIDN